MVIHLTFFFWLFMTGSGLAQSTNVDSLMVNVEDCIIQTLLSNGMKFTRPDTNDVFLVKTMVLKATLRSTGNLHWSEIPMGYNNAVLFEKTDFDEVSQIVCNDELVALKHIWGEGDWSVLFIFDHFMFGPNTYMSDAEIASKVSMASDAKVDSLIEMESKTINLKKTIRLLFKVGSVSQ